ncbi:MAG: pro-sigmaK processing inhibitor BofA family protein [Oscillospiraceae bacterium]|nr:pro-sigmaK processing inhibitor BofA family protein [Oscillospiraceae bacterium]
MNISSVIAAVAVILAVWLLIKILALPVRFIIKLLINAHCGFVSLLKVNLFGGLLGFSHENDLINCLICGVFGIPGIIILIILSLI